MYYPYLYGRQSELLAVRDVAHTLGDESEVRPVIEPVRVRSGSLRVTLEEAEKADFTTYTVVNPALGDFALAANAKDAAAWRDWAWDFLDEQTCAYAACLIDHNTSAVELRAFLKHFADEPVGFVLRNPGLALSDIAAMVSTHTDDYRYLLTGASPTVATLAALGKGDCVHVDPRFIVQARNSDYAGIEPFTDSHSTYAKAGLAGFSDYTVLDDQYREGGGPAGAVAIHLTFLDRPTEELHVEHFVSDTTDRGIRDNELKFIEAARKILPAVRRTSSNFGDTAALNRYLTAVATSSPPTLAGNKRWQIGHHLELVDGILNGSVT